MNNADSPEAVRTRVVTLLNRTRGLFGNLLRGFRFAGEVSDETYAKQAVDAYDEMTSLRESYAHKLPASAVAEIDAFLKIILRVRLNIGTLEEPAADGELRVRVRDEAFQLLDKDAGACIERVLAIFREIELGPEIQREAGSGAPQFSSSSPKPVSQRTTHPLRTPESLKRLSPGEVLRGRFEIQSYLGSGGSGDVYAARDRKVDDVVAVKILRDRTPETIARLQQEVRLARGLVHPALCRVIDFETVTEDSPAFLTMELLRGETLQAFLIHTPLPSLDTTRSIIEPVLDGLDVAHRSGVLHRDLKPANIFLQEDIDHRPVVITDFGLARSLVSAGTSLTDSGDFVGTPDYMAPEQARGIALTPAADLYSVGVILFEILTGRKPFSGGTYVEVLSRKMETDPPSPRSLDPRISSEMDRVVLKCLARRPDQRYQDARSLLGALETAGIGSNVSGQTLEGSEAQLASTSGARIEISFKASSRSTDRHRYRLVVNLTMGTSSSVPHARLDLEWPAEIPLLNAVGLQDEAKPGQGHRLTLNLKDHLYPGEQRTLVGPDLANRIEYLFDDNVYEAVLSKDPLLRFRMLGPEGVLVEGTTPFSKLNEF